MDRRTWVAFSGHLDGYTIKNCYEMSVPLNNDDDDDDDDESLIKL